ncbi:MAG: hypothetical protein M1383_02485 [Patescibacteria group bacterium]|nr:hypothetical protein [Patescibacteria group bacterium]
MSNDLKQPVTKEHLEKFMEQSFLPAISTLMDEKLENHPAKDDLRKEFNIFEQKMDEKLSDLKGDLAILLRKEDKKIGCANSNFKKQKDNFRG